MRFTPTCSQQHHLGVCLLSSITQTPFTIAVKNISWSLPSVSTEVFGAHVYEFLSLIRIEGLLKGRFCSGNDIPQEQQG